LLLAIRHARDLMPPRIRNASLRWRLGKIAHEEKRAADRALVARWNAAKAAPAPRGPRGKAEPILIQGMDPKAYARSIGVRF
jgi:hypothetical protein